MTNGTVDWIISDSCSSEPYWSNVTSIDVSPDIVLDDCGTCCHDSLYLRYDSESYPQGPCFSFEADVV